MTSRHVRFLLAIRLHTSHYKHMRKRIPTLLRRSVHGSRTFQVSQTAAYRKHGLEQRSSSGLPLAPTVRLLYFAPVHYTFFLRHHHGTPAQARRPGCDECTATLCTATVSTALVVMGQQVPHLVYK